MLKVFLFMFFFCYSTDAFAKKNQYFPQPNGRFQFYVLEKGDTYKLPDSYYDSDEDEGEGGNEIVTGEYNVSEGELLAYNTGAFFWDTILGPYAKNTSPIFSVLQTIDVADDNASASSPIIEEEGDLQGMTEFGAAIINNRPSKVAAFLTVDKAIDPNGWYTGEMRLLPKNGTQADLTSTITHELYHALGGFSSAGEGEDEENNPGYAFGDTLSKWDEHLFDVEEKKAQAGQTIIVGENACDDEEECFVTANNTQWSGVYFSGDNVDEVLNEAELLAPSESGSGDRYAGIPINTWEPKSGGGYSLDLSHIELRNSLQSHLSYRNWNTFMEAELAILQDLGYTIDRRNFFGYSVYHDNVETRGFINENPFYARLNGDFLEGVPNTTPWGIGLHIYGSLNDVTQKANLLADGNFSAGIRVDGWENALTIDSDTLVTANGDYGYGVLFSYGKEHTLDVQGTVEAMGKDGIALAFDFGDNELGSLIETRGSYIRVNKLSSDWEQMDLFDELDGSLMEEVNVSGTVSGRLAAVYIGSTAHVAQINILSGASVTGDIISDWNPNSELLADSAPDDLFTTLTFGTDGNGGADADFNMTMSGNISGMDSLDMVLQAGSLGVDGVIDVNSLTTQADSVLTLFIDNDVKTRSVVVANTIDIGGTLNYTFSESLYGLKQGDIISVLNAADSLTLNNEHQMSYSLEAILDYYKFEYVFDDNMSGWKVISAKSKQKGTQSSSIMMTSVINAVGNKVTGRLGAISTPVFGVKGKSGGNTFEETGIWGKALYTHAHKSGTNGFKADAIGGVVGLDGKPSQHLTAGLALSYSRTAADAGESDTDIDTYAAFLYGKYEQTEKLSYSAVVGYGLSQFKMPASLDFDAHFANIQGYVDYVLGKCFVLQGGARYVYAHQEKYNIGNTTYKTNDTDTLTAVLGGSYNYAQSRWFAQARLAAIYDLVSDKGDLKAIASGASLYMDGERLHRFGAEAGVTAGFRTNKWLFELGYDAQIRKDYNDQTLSLKAGYQF